MCPGTKKDIIVIGGLYGNAYAGTNGEEGHFVIALDFSPECLKIDKLRYEVGKKAKWPIKPKYQPKIAHVVNGVVVIEPISRDFTKNL